MNHFYTYTYYIDDIPVYVGKGKGTRCTAHLGARGEWADCLRAAIAANKNVRCDISQPTTEAAAFAMEIERIAQFGRRDKGTGTLYNRTDGGDGNSGAQLSDQTKAKMSTAMSNIPKSPEHRAKLSEAARIRHENTRNLKRNQPMTTPSSNFKEAYAQFTAAIALLRESGNFKISYTTAVNAIENKLATLAKQ